MAREKKINFIEAHLAGKVTNDSSQFRVTIMTQPSKVLSFPAKHPETRQLVGKYLKYFVDPQKNILGWKVFDEGKLDDLSNTFRVAEYQVKKKDGKIEGSIVRANAALPLKNLVVPKSAKKLLVQKYRETGHLNDGRNIYYVEIEKPVMSSVVPPVLASMESDGIGSAE